KVEGVPVVEKLPKLPVARVLWRPLPDMKTGCSAWIYAGGAHHTAYSLSLTPEYLEDFARIAGLEYVASDENTTLTGLDTQLSWNELYDLLKKLPNQGFPPHDDVTGRLFVSIKLYNKWENLRQ